MYIDNLSLTDFRTYEQQDVQLGAGVNLLIGSNGVGKTNIVEAISYLSSLASHRTSADAPLVRFGQERAIVRARVRRGNQQSVLEVEIAPGRINRARINRSAPMRAREIMGIARVVLFAPEDLALVKSDPSHRRRFLDDLVVLLYPYLGKARSDYEKILRQRNALLKSGRSRWDETHEATIDVWDQQLARAAAALTHARLKIVAALAPLIDDSYERLSRGSKKTEVFYLSSLGPDMEAQRTSPQRAFSDSLSQKTLEELYVLYREALGEARSKDRERATTTIGPHRDDIALLLGSAPAKNFASHGETWSFALALRLSSFALLRADDPSEAACPILILDDVFAELDDARRQRLGELVSEAEQVLITAAVESDIPDSLKGKRFSVTLGKVVDDER